MESRVSRPAIGKILVDNINKIIKHFVEATGYRRIFLLAALAVVSALLTQFAVNDPWQILSVYLPAIDTPASSQSGMNYVHVPILPGMYFGSVLAIGACAWKRNNLFAACVVFLCTAIAWIVAVEFAYSTDI